MQKPFHILSIVLITGVILCVAIYRIGWFMPPTSIEMEKAKKLAIAIAQDTPLVSVQGNVFLPDGSPAEFFYVHAQSCAYVPSPFTNDAYLQQHSFMGNFSGGVFNASALPGANVIIAFTPWEYAADQVNPNRQFVAKPIVVVPRENMEPLTITLEEGIPVRGKLTYDNGASASDRRLSFRQQVEPVVGADIHEMRNALWFDRSARANADGEYEIFLPPDEYTVFHRHGEDERKESLMIKSTDLIKHLDWTLPTPVFVETYTEAELENTSPRQTCYSIAEEGKGSSTFFGDKLDSFILEPVAIDSTLYIADLDNKVGTIETITPAMKGKTVRFELKPMSSIAVTLVDMDGKPISEKRVSYSIRALETNSFSPSHRDNVTDSDGKVVLPVFSGRHTVVIGLPGSFVSPLPGGGRHIQSSLEQELNLASGETYDFGTIKLTEIFEETHPCGFNASAAQCCP